MSASLPSPPSTPGAVCSASGVVVTVASPDATALQVEWQAQCGEAPLQTALSRIDEIWWSGVLPNATVGTRYALRADGPFQPDAGLCFNPAKLLLDPNAHALDGPVVWHPDLRLTRADTGARCPADNAPSLPRCVVTDDQFDWGADRAPKTPLAESVIYEAHCKGLTMLHPLVPPAQRGRYAGLRHPAVLEHLVQLGVTSVQLLPVQQAGLDQAQVTRHVGNYWGYAPALFAAPDHRFASGADGRQVREFQEMVQGLHAAGLEVILDVVFNHTLEGGGDGALLHLRGLADRHYYLRQPGNAARYLDTTGCGHAVASHDPLARRLILDALRWWVTVCRVDGFRFDLGATLTRGADGAAGASPLFDEITADPILGAVKCIVEPWDLGSGGYRLGSFRPPIVEWNDRARAGLRAFWYGNRDAADFARRVTGSDDIFPRRGPLGGVTYATCHDGFALADLVRYTVPRTGANGEGGADALFAGGRADDGGPDGPAPDDSALEQQRDDTARALLASSLLALGVPMLAHGDERLQSRLGNANPYCHDSPLTWLDWSPTPRAEATNDVARATLAARRRWPALRRPDFWPEGTAHRTLSWFDADGRPMRQADWRGGASTLVAEAPAGVGAERLCWIWNAATLPATVQLPPTTSAWTIEVVTASGLHLTEQSAIVPARCLVLLVGSARTPPVR